MDFDVDCLGQGMQEVNSVRPKGGEERRVQGAEDGEAAEFGEEVDADIDGETRGPRSIHDLALPSRVEMDMHMLAHALVGPWWELCAKER